MQATLVRPDHARGRRVHRSARSPRQAGARARSELGSEGDDLEAPIPSREMISVVVPLLNEEHSLETLYREIASALEPLEHDFEVVFVDDGSTDGSLSVLDAAARRDSRTSWSCTYGGTSGRPRRCRPASSRLAGDHRDRSTPTSRTTPPRSRSSSPSSTRASTSSRAGRRDATTRSRRRLFSRVFNWATGVVSGVHLHDVNCGLKAYRAEVLQGMRLYGELHRFIPILAAYRGYRDRGDPREPPSRDSTDARATDPSATSAASSTS